MYAWVRALLGAAMEAGQAVIGVVNPNNAGAWRLLDEMTPHAIVLAPVESAALTYNIALAQIAARQQRRQLGKIAKLEETLRSSRKVEQAKAILMKQRNIAEPEAYTYLRDQAMRRRVPVGVVASVLVEASSILSDDRLQPED
jgi:AmiR/NasT family two-component response regulator